MLHLAKVHTRLRYESRLWRVECLVSQCISEHRSRQTTVTCEQWQSGNDKMVDKPKWRHNGMAGVTNKGLHTNTFIFPPKGNLVFVSRKKGSKTKKITKEEEIERRDYRPPMSSIVLGLILTAIMFWKDFLTFILPRFFSFLPTLFFYFFSQHQQPVFQNTFPQACPLSAIFKYYSIYSLLFLFTRFAQRKRRGDSEERGAKKDISTKQKKKKKRSLVSCKESRFYSCHVCTQTMV